MKIELQAIRPNEDESLIIELAKTAYKFFEKHPNEYAADVYVKNDDGIVGHAGQIVNPKYATIVDSAASMLSIYNNRRLIRTVMLKDK
jgi:hypothetical protein